MHSLTNITLFVAIAAGLTMPANPIGPNLIPNFGIEAGQDPDGSGSYAGANGILIPCVCPPIREQFIQQVNLAVTSGNFLGTPVVFNGDPSAQSSIEKFNRATTCLIVLQSFNGTRGVGCPAVSAPNILNQQKQFAP